MEYEKRTVEIVGLGNEVILEGVEIEGVKYSLKISNFNGRLSLDFNDGDYRIIVDEEGVGFSRCRYRPNHDHNDLESLQITDKEKLIWMDRFPYSGEGRIHFNIPFGSVRGEF